MAQSMPASSSPPAPPASGREEIPAPTDDRSSSITTPPGDKAKTTGQDDYKSADGGWMHGIRNLRNYICCIPRRESSSSTKPKIRMGSAAVSSSLPRNADNAQLKGGWDEGVFSGELLKQSIFPRNIPATHAGNTITPPKDAGKPASLETGTYEGTKLALTQMTKRIESRFGSYFDVAGFETSVPVESTVKAKQLYTFQKKGSDNYPPHLDMIPAMDQVSLLQIFNSMQLLDTGTLLGTIIPDKILDFIHDHPEGATVSAIETRNKLLLNEKKDIFDEDNVGSRADWWTDNVFAQQSFIGANPTTVQKASASWVNDFAELAQSNQEMSSLLSGDVDSFYVQDYSDFRALLGAPVQSDLASSDGSRRLPTTVTLFQLGPTGVLHPLAIAIDFKKSLKESVVIFNKRISPSSPEPKDDWPWRYAKTCAQVSDWFRHEVAIHLVNTHLIEEATIVAAHRAFSIDHPAFKLLQPHWLKTLSVNAAARSALVPNVITKIVGVTDPQLFSFVQKSYKNFDFTGKYIPNDLKARGFPPEQLASDPRFHNYAYGRNMIIMWQTLHKYVQAVIAIDLNSDDQVAHDAQIAAWCAEMRGDDGGQLKSFPEIKTVAELVDAVTMCLHIASPQHTAINYLQNYYQVFVPNKPSAMFKPLPKSLQELQAYKEEDLVNSYPINHAREWLLASHVPHLLSYRVAEDQNLLNFALSTSKLATQSKQDALLAAAASQLYTDLVQLVDVFKKNGKDLDDQTKAYDVMDPKVTAVSILL